MFCLLLVDLAFKCFESCLDTLLSLTQCIDELLIKVKGSAQPCATVQMMFSNITAGLFEGMQKVFVHMNKHKLA